MDFELRLIQFSRPNCPSLKLLLQINPSVQSGGWVKINLLLRNIFSRAAAAAGDGGLVAAGPASSPPDYAAIDAQPLNRVVYGLFRQRMVQAVGNDSKLEG